MAPTLISSSFRDIVSAAEAIGSGLGLTSTIALYTDWIAAQATGTPDLQAAWFNLGTEYGQAGNTPAAMLAYRTALTICPGFAQAAINLGLLLERHGQPATALQVWADALQSDDSRTALLNQQARLLEQSGDLAQAAEVLRISLLTRHDQPDAVQH
jgi:tetratricopeptide (TPR) repeat protein